jgi:ubiquitin
MDIDWGDSEPYHISTCDGSMAHQNHFSNQQQSFYTNEHQFEDAMSDSNNYFLSSNDNNGQTFERRGLKRKASFADLGDPAAALSFVNKRMKRLKLPTCDNQFSMQIRVKTLVGRAINLRVEPADTVANLKEKLQAIAGVPHDHQRLIFNGKTLPDDRIVTQVINLRDGALIHMVLSMSGG